MAYIYDIIMLKTTGLGGIDDPFPDLGIEMKPIYTENAGGGRYQNYDMLACSMSNFDEDEVLSRFYSAKLDSPERFVLLIKGEEEAGFRIYKGDDEEMWREYGAKDVKP